VFAVIKLKFEYTKAKYRGIRKNANQVFTLCALSDLFLLRGLLLVTQGAKCLWTHSRDDDNLQVGRS
jgi:hypothetical protein